MGQRQKENRRFTNKSLKSLWLLQTDCETGAVGLATVVLVSACVRGDIAQSSLSLHASPAVSTFPGHHLHPARHLSVSPRAISSSLWRHRDMIAFRSPPLLAVRNFLLLLFLHIQSWRQNETLACKSCRIAECSFSYWLVVFPPPALFSMVCHLVDKWLAMAPPCNHSTDWRRRGYVKFSIILFLPDWRVVTSGGKVTLQHFQRMCQ